MQPRTIRMGLAVVAWAVLGATGAQALEVDEVSPPRLGLEGEFVSTLDYRRRTPATEGATATGDTHVNTDDSNVVLTLDKPLYGTGLVGGMVLNLHLAEDAVAPRLSAFLGTSAYRLSIGRMALRTTLVRFATVRDGDLFAYTHVPNGALGLTEEAAHQYGDVLALDWYFRPAFLRVSAFGAERVQTVDQGGGTYAVDEDARANSGGLAIAYEVPDGLRHEHALRTLAVLHDVQSLERRGGDRARQFASLIALVMGVNDNPEYPWELGLQVLRNSGLQDSDTLGNRVLAADEEALAREASTATVLGLGYHHRKYLQTRWRAGLTLAHKRFADLPDATQSSVVPAWFNRIGNGIDLVAQAVYTRYSDGLAAIVGRTDDLAVQIGVTLKLEAGFNDNVVEPGSILEMEQGRLFRGY